MKYIRKNLVLTTIVACIFINLIKLNADIFLPSQISYMKNPVLHFAKSSGCSEEKINLLYELILANRPTTCVEIGVFKGASAFPILTALKTLKTGHLYLIDPWSDKIKTLDWPETDPSTLYWKEVEMSSAKRYFDWAIDTWSFRSICTILPCTSEEVVDQIHEIDFLHLDGNFSETTALYDCLNYLPKVTPGGYILVSNAIIWLGGKPTKAATLWHLFEQCELVCEIERGNTLLFRKF